MNSNKPCIECEVCTLPYNKDQRAPRIFALCGHTICSECLRSLLQKTSSDTLNCVFCRTAHTLNIQNLTDLTIFPKNLSIISLMDVNSPSSSQHICLEHDQPTSFICLDTKCPKNELLCHKCLLNTIKCVNLT